ncbi:MAG: hypothetical protein ABW360_17465 [Phenylobacterium sp.]
MSKYKALSDRLRGHAGEEWRATFAEIEEVLGFPLPKGARTGKAWWTSGTWEGWQAQEIDHAAGAVTFRRSGLLPADEPLGDEEPSVGEDIEGDPPKDALAIPAPPETPTVDVKKAAPKAALIAGGVAVVAGVGALLLRQLIRRR